MTGEWVSLLLPLGALALQSPAEIASIRSTHAARRGYLAEAVVWRDPGPITVERILEGRPGRFRLSFQEANRPEGFPCAFQHAGQSLGGKTRKFICRTPEGESLRIKYYEGPGGNREVFASVAATRLLWMLGFDSDSVYPVVVNCLDCPEDPWTGSGPKSSRVLLGTVEPHFEGTLILSGADPEQGWTFQELDEATRSLPPGAIRGRQRMHFDALTLLGVLIQHGDRKPSQQRLTCRGGIDFGAGDVHRVSSSGASDWGAPVLFEREGARSCAAPAVTVQDMGATFGGGGLYTSGRGTKMNLHEWARHDVFRDSPYRYHPPRDIDCTGNLIVSQTARGGEGTPPISEEGRVFLLQQLERLEPEHLRSLFTAARVETLGEENRYQDPKSGELYLGVDAWVHVFQRKVQEIEETRCRPF
jgi:hypothetical protein